MKYIAPSWESIFSQSVKLAAKLEAGKGDFDCIVGVSRGGLVLTRLISDLLEIQDVMITRSEYYTDVGKRRERPEITQPIHGKISGRRVLLLDDVADTGESLIEIVRYLKSKKPKELTVATLYIKPWSKVLPDYFVSRTDAWIIFPWERLEAIRSLARNGTREFMKTGLPKRVIRKVLEFQERKAKARSVK